MKKTNTGFSLIFGLIIIILVSTMSLFLLSFIIPYAQNVKGLENSTKAFYLANSAVEQALWYMKQNNLGDEDTKVFSGDSDYSYDIDANGTLIPDVDEGDSPFDNDWNTIAYGKPLQLLVGKGMIQDGWSNMRFNFRVPDFDEDGNFSDQQVEGDATTTILTRQLSSTSNTLFPENLTDFITTTDINGGIFTLNARGGLELDGTSRVFSSFYLNNCTGLLDDCILRISPLANMFMEGTKPIPFLEYQIDTGGDSIPTRFTNITIAGKSYGFQKNFTVRVPQLTTDQAFDFTVFQ